jgi:hypothetical protein
MVVEEDESVEGRNVGEDGCERETCVSGGIGSEGQRGEWEIGVPI